MLTREAYDRRICLLPGRTAVGTGARYLSAEGRGKNAAFVCSEEGLIYDAFDISVYFGHEAFAVGLCF